MPSSSPTSLLSTSQPINLLISLDDFRSHITLASPLHPKYSRSYPQRRRKKNNLGTRRRQTRLARSPTCLGAIIDLDHDDTRTKDERRDETRRDETRQSQFTYDATNPSSRLFSQIGTATLALQLALHQIESQLPNRPKQPRPSSPCPELQRVPSPKLETSSKSNRYTGAVGVLICSGLCDSHLPPPEIHPRKGPRAFQAFPSVFAPEVRILTASHPEWSSVHSTVHT